MEHEELVRICSNCNYFFPASVDEETEDGICLYDDVFEPFLDELLENCNYVPCQELVEKKKFHGETAACEHFEEPEEYEIDDDSHLGQALEYAKSSGQFDTEAIRAAFLMDELKKVDWKTIPLDQHVAHLNSSDPTEQLQAIPTLVYFSNYGNEKALELLINYFKNIPPPTTLDEVHFKIDVFRELGFLKNESVLISPLIHELFLIESNNTTLQWISKILEFLAHCPKEQVYPPLEKLIKERKFSYRLKAKIKNIMVDSDEDFI